MMLAYHSDPRIKMKVLSQLLRHAQADEIIKGRYWEDGKGCAVGCTIHSDQHAEYEDRFGIPQALARLEDCIFEGLPNGTAKAWPRRFMSAVRPGSDLSRVQWRFLHWLLTDKDVNPGIDHPLVHDAVRRCADLMRDLSEGKTAHSARLAAYSAAYARSAADSAARSAAYSARSAARSAAYSARSAARSAAYSARSAADSAAYSATDSARLAAYSAARSAAYSARSAADSAAYSAADSAAYSAESADSAYSAESAARERAYVLMADKLIELIKGAP